MEDLYASSLIFFRSVLISAAFLLLGFQGVAQSEVNINKPGSSPATEVNLPEQANVPFFAMAKRARSFGLNPEIANPRSLEVGNRIRLELFRDKDFKSTIISKTKDVNGVTTFTVKMDEFKYAFAYIVVSPDSYLITADIPELNEKYTTRTNLDSDTDYLILLDESKMEKFEECEPVLQNEEGNNGDAQPQSNDGETEDFNLSGASTSNDPATIDIMIVYTPAAQEWSNMYDNGINNTIATAMATANTVSTNSHLGINFNLVYSGLVDYIEQGSGTDLGALRMKDDGLLDEVHEIRKNVGADMVAFFTNTSGGVAYLINNRNGQPDTPFSITGIASAKSLTFPHELSHNMGLGHYKYQKVQPGNTVWSNWEENTWSGGWRWLSSDDNMYCDIMTYTSGEYHDDGIYTQRVPYVSDPDHVYMDGQAGDIEEGNGRLTLREMKHVIANYSNEIIYCDAMAMIYGPLYINHVSIGEIENSSVDSGFSNFTPISGNLLPQQTHTLTVDVTGVATNKQLLVWVDWNEDGEFDVLTEQEYASEIGDVDQFVTTITAPLGVMPGDKRMRIRLHDLENGSNDTPCGKSGIGEVEDYTLNLESATPCTEAMEPVNLEASEIFKDSFLISWQPVEGIDSYDLRYRISGTETWTSRQELKYPFQNLEGLDPETTYEVQVRSLCSGSASGFSSSELVTTKAAAVEMAFEDQPVDAEAGRTLAAITVHLRDADGNLNSSKEEVSLSLLDPENIGAQLSGKISVVAKEGIATFIDLTIDKEGTFSLQANAEDLASVESAAFTIEAFDSQTFIVNSEADHPDADLNDNTCADQNGNCTLRAAIQNANKTNAKEIIHFNIPGSNPPEIVLNDGLPAITAPVVIDGTTQPNYSFGSYQVVINGSAVAGTSEADGDYAFGLMGKSSGSTIKGFTVGGFDAGLHTMAFHLRNTNDHFIEGNKIGTTVDGQSKFENYDGIYLENSNNNSIGGPAEGQKNLISGNLRGITFDNSQNNRVIKNYIGTNITGNDTIPNKFGIAGAVDGRKTINGVFAFSSNNVISENMISGNQMGLLIMGNENRIEKNRIGTNIDGTNALGNQQGIDVRYGSDNIVGGEANGNIISGNVQGLIISETLNIKVSHNSIGTDLEGFAAIPNETGIYLRGDVQTISNNVFDKNIISGNSENGVLVETSHNRFTNNFIGVTGDGNNKLPNMTGVNIAAGENNTIGSISNGNIISGNLQHGIHIGYSRENKILGNLIGVSKDEASLGNGGEGIFLTGSHKTTIGGGEGNENIIAWNGGAGVAIIQYGNNNEISQNSIYSNTSLGIDLEANGVTSNDREDRDSGPNDFLNFPELKSPAALEGTTLNLEYLVTSAPQYSAFPIKVEFFKSDGNGQGKEYIGTDIFTENDITKGKKGKVINLELVPGTSLNGGDEIVATAIDSNGNTSEFGNSADVTGGCAETTYYADSDEDGLGDPDVSQTACSQPQGYVDNDEDCDDSDPELGSGITWYADKDEDGFGDPADTITACDLPEGYVDNSDDCDDTDALLNPETIWYADSDGDGFGNSEDALAACDQPEGYVSNSDDCDDTDAGVLEGTTWYADQDGDGYGDPETSETACSQPSGFVDNNEDCDDSSAEIGNGPSWYADTDGDGYGDPEESIISCDQPAGYVDNNEDCDDKNELVNPATTWYRDNDGDGFGDPDVTATGCEQPAGYVTNSEDCDDTDATLNPNLTWYADADGDGFGDPEDTTTSCTAPSGFVSNNEDCDDTDATYNPAATDVCKDCDPTNDDACETECLGTDVLYLAEVCTDGNQVNWVITNPGNCTVEVRWELRKREDFGNLTVPPGESYFTSGVASRGSTQVTIYWNNSSGVETKTNSNASGITCTSATAMEDETMGDTSENLSIYPNPISSEGIWLHFAEREKASEFEVVAYNLNGYKLAGTVVKVAASGSDILWEVDHSRWIPGIYIVNATNGEEMYQIKIIKE